MSTTTCSAGPMEPPDAARSRLPSASPTYRSLAQALLFRDPRLWQPGEPNTDWRLHAREPNDLKLPWSP